jgi:plasmid stabilization system protein ParE
VKTVRVDERARREAREAAEWYTERGRMLGRKFRDELLAALFYAASYPLSCSPYLHGTRRVSLKKFPYFVIFLDWEGRIFVVAVAHAKRREGYWKARI